MKALLRFRPSLNYRAWLLTLGLGYAGSALAGQTRPLAEPSRQPSTPASLRVIITPLPNSSVLRVRYESAGPGAVRLQLRDDQDQVRYTRVLRQAQYAADFDLTAWPAGTYLIELQASGTRHRETFRLATRSMVVATIVAMENDELVAGEQLP